MSTLRSDDEDAARRAYLGVSRGTLVEADDKRKMQEVTIRARFGRMLTNVEHWQPYGFTAVPLPPDDQEQKQAECLLAYLGGSPDHPVVISVGDRRYRLTELKPGDVAQHDHRKQQLVLHKDGITKQSPMTITTQVVDGEGKVLSTIVQEKGGQKITMTSKGGASVTLDGANITKKAGPGGKVTIEGDVDLKGGLSATKAISALAMLAGGLPVKTS